MKSVKKNNRSNSYPVLKEYLYDNKFIVLFVAKNFGFVVHSENTMYKIGQGEPFSEDCFAIYNGDIKLSNR